jgi:hypothetical protein
MNTTSAEIQIYMCYKKYLSSKDAMGVGSPMGEFSCQGFDRS